MQEKEARERALEEEKEAEKRERDREFATLLERQEQAMDQVAERHTLAAKRQQEAVERERRQREAEKAKRQEEVSPSYLLTDMKHKSMSRVLSPF